MINLSDDLLKIKKASYKLATIDTDLKNKILENISNLQKFSNLYHYIFLAMILIT